MGVFIVREEIRKKHKDLLKSCESKMGTGAFFIDTHDKIRMETYIDCIESCNDLLDIATLGDIASTKEELEG
jgi:hypothetical protein